MLVRLVAVSVAAAAAAGPPTFAPRELVVTTSPGAGASELAAGDLTGDGRPDAVVTRLSIPLSTQAFPVGVIGVDASGRWRDLTTDVFGGEVPRTVHARQIVIADLNRDGRNDLFIADHGYDAPPFPGNHNTLALSRADGKLVDATASLPPDTGFHHSAAAADVDRDGDIDVFVGTLGGNGSSIYVNDGSGRFTRDPSRIPREHNAVHPAGRYTRGRLVDVTGDGAADLVLGADNQTPQSVVLVNNGAGSFTRSVALPDKPFGPTGVAHAFEPIDLDRDGDADLLAAYTRGNPLGEGRLLQALVNQGAGVFVDETATRLPPQGDNRSAFPLDIRLADVDGDGHLDFGVALNSGAREQPPLYLNRGDGTFAEHPGGIPGVPPLFAWLDANADGLPDALGVLGSPTDERHYLVAQTRPAPPPPPSPAQVRPAAPQSLRATVLRDRVRLTWRAVIGATAYDVLRSGRRIATVRAARFDDRSARPRVTYVYRVTAVSGSGRSAPSKAVRVRRP